MKEENDQEQESKPPLVLFHYIGGGRAHAVVPPIQRGIGSDIEIFVTKRAKKRFYRPVFKRSGLEQEQETRWIELVMKGEK